MINISELITDPDFNQNFNVIRTTGTYVTGRFTTTTTTIAFTGVIDPLNTKDMLQLPEGDTIKGAINVYTLAALNTTQATTAGAGTLPDEVVWMGENYKVLNVKNYADYGYYKATAVRKKGD